MTNKEEQIKNYQECKAIIHSLNMEKGDGGEAVKNFINDKIDKIDGDLIEIIFLLLVKNSEESSENLSLLINKYNDLIDRVEDEDEYKSNYNYAFITYHISQLPKLSYENHLNDKHVDELLSVFKKFIKVKKYEAPKLLTHTIEMFFTYILKYPDVKLLNKMKHDFDFISNKEKININILVFDRPRYMDEDKFDDMYKVVDIIKDKIPNKQIDYMMVSASFNGHDKLIDNIYSLTNKERVYKMAKIQASLLDIDESEMVEKVMTQYARLDKKDLKANISVKQKERKRIF